MSAGQWLDAVQRFVEVAAEVANSLDFATVVREPRHPLAWRTETLRSLWWDLYSEGRKAGASAIPAVEAGKAIIDELAVVANAHDDGDLDPWLDRRDRVRELLGELLAAGPQVGPTIDDRNVALRQSHAKDATRVIGGDDEIKGEKGDNVPMLAGKLTRNPRAILRAMMQEGATTMARSWNASELADHARLSDGQMRRAMETLRKHGLYESHRGQDGGVWLTPLGMAVAESMR